MTRLWRNLRAKFWVVPLSCAVLAAVAGLALTAVDQWLDTGLKVPFLFTGGPEGARALLSAIISSMISFTGLVFSITIVVLQLTSSQFSPRVLRTFLRDWVNQLALGVFVATFVYALVVLRAVRGTAQTEAVVPQISVTVAFGFVLASVVVFIVYIDHIAQSIRAATIVTRIAEETREVLEGQHPPVQDGPSPRPLPATRGRCVHADATGVIQQVDDAALSTLAEEHAVVVVLLRAVGEFVPAGAPLLAVYGENGPDDPDGPDDRALQAAVHVGNERALDEDLAFGFRQLVDVAERALSPGTNDPTTAVQVIDQLHDLLRRLATRPLLPRQRIGRSGRLVVHVPQPGFEELLGLAVDEIAYWGADVERIQRRLRVMLDDLDAAATVPAHRSAVRRATESLSDGPGGPPRHRTDGAPRPSDTGLR